MSGKMSGRERIMAALTHKPVDRLPFTPLIDSYAIMGLPPEFTGDISLSPLHPRRQIATLKAFGADLLIRNIAAFDATVPGARQVQSLGAFVSPVETKTEIRDRDICEIITTPAGTLTGKWRLMETAGTIPHFTRYVVNSAEELKIYATAVEHLNPQPPAPRYDVFQRYDNQLGDEGVPCAGITNSPFMFLIEFVMGLENTYLLLNEHRELVEYVLEKLHESQRRLIEVLAQSPAKVIIQYENTSSTLLSPAYYRRYCAPVLNDYARIFRQAGKIYLIHMCGKLRAMAGEIKFGEYDGICDIAPAPTGDLPLYEAKEKLPEKVVLGGIDATTFTSQDSEFVRTEVANLIQKVKPLRGVLVGSGDAMPKNARPENILTVRNLIDTLGTYEAGGGTRYL